MNQRSDAKQFAADVVQMVQDSDLHKSLTWAELIDAIASVFDGVILDDDVANMRTFAAGIRRSAIAD